MIGRVAFGIGLFAGSLVLGRSLAARRLLTDAQADRLIRRVVKRLSPIVLCLSFWRLNLTDLRPLLLPLVGLTVSLGALLPALAYTRFTHLTRAQQGSFVTCAMFSNIGFLGAVIAFALFGETGYSLAMLYVVYFNPCFYLAGFAMAMRFSHKPAARRRPFWTDELRLYPFLGLCAGFALALLRVPRPAAVSIVNHLLIPLDASLYLVAVGSQLQFDPPRRWWRPSVAMCLIKFVYCPLVGWLLIRMLRLDGLLRSVVLLQACMPVATSPLMLPMLFGLDRKLSNALWLATTLVCLPALLLGYPLLLAGQ